MMVGKRAWWAAMLAIVVSGCSYTTDYTVTFDQSGHMTRFAVQVGSGPARNGSFGTNSSRR